MAQEPDVERMTDKERREAAEICMAEAPEAFPDLAHAEHFVRVVEALARRLHRLYEKACSEPLTQEDRRDRLAAESDLRTGFAEKGLGLYLQSDPRGHPVGIHTPKTGRSNSWGGAECGWRL